MAPAAMVDMMGVLLSLTRARYEKSRPSRAMAKIIRGRGNMEPSRLGDRKEEEEDRFQKQKKRKRKQQTNKQTNKEWKNGRKKGREV